MDSLSVSFTTIWDERQSSSLLQDYAISHGAIAKQGNSFGVLFGQHLLARPHSSTIEGSYSFDTDIPNQIGIYHKLEEKHPETRPNIGLLGLYIRHEKDENQNTSKETNKTTFEDKTRNGKGPLMQMDRSLIRKMTAMIPAVGEALLHVRFMQRDLA